MFQASEPDIKTTMNGISIKDLTEDWKRKPTVHTPLNFSAGELTWQDPLAPSIEALARSEPVGIAPHVFEAHEAAKSRSMLHLAHTAPVSPGLALAAWQASEEARNAPKPPRKGVSFSISTHGFKSYRATITRRF